MAGWQERNQLLSQEIYHRNMYSLTQFCQKRHESPNSFCKVEALSDYFPVRRWQSSPDLYDVPVKTYSIERTCHHSHRLDQKHDYFQMAQEFQPITLQLIAVCKTLHHVFLPQKRIVRES